MPVSGSITASARVSTSDRIRTVWKMDTAITSAKGAITSGGLSNTAWASTPNATASRSTIVIATPTAIPRSEKRALSEMSGMANQDIVGTLGPPVIATETAMIT